MSQENVDLVRNLYALGDFFNPNQDQVDRAFRDYLDEQVEVHLPPDYPEGEPVFRGRDGLAQMHTMLQEVWAEWEMVAERFLDAGDRVVVFARLLGKGVGSGAPFELETAHVWTIHSGRAASMYAYRDRSEALKAAGLREQAGLRLGGRYPPQEPPRPAWTPRGGVHARDESDRSDSSPGEQVT